METSRSERADLALVAGRAGSRSEVDRRTIGGVYQIERQLKAVRKAEQGSLKRITPMIESLHTN